MGLLTHKSLFFLFLMTSVLLVLSWVLVLRSTGRSHPFDLSILPNSKLLAMAENEYPKKSPLISASMGETKVRRNDISRKSDSDRQVLKVFMYDLPSEFHFSRLGWKRKGRSVWPDIRAEVPGYPGGLNLQHSIEYWLTLDLLNSDFADSLGCRSATLLYFQGAIYGKD